MKIWVLVLSLLSLIACKPKQSGTSQPVSQASLTDGHPMSPSTDNLCAINNIESRQKFGPEASYLGCNQNELSQQNPSSLDSYKDYCHCGSHEQYCMIWKNGDLQATGFTKAQPCDPDSCVAYFRPIIERYCGGKWLYRRP